MVNQAITTKEKEKLFTQMKKTGNYEIKDVSIHHRPYKIT